MSGVQWFMIQQQKEQKEKLIYFKCCFQTKFVIYGAVWVRSTCRSLPPPHPAPLSTY